MKKIIFTFIILLLVSRLTKAQNCNNIGFENDSTSGWNLSSGNITGVNLPCNTCTASTVAIATVVTTTSSISTQCNNGIDAYGGFPVVYPDGGNYSLLLNNDSAKGKIQEATFSIPVMAAGYDVVTFSFAAVLKSGGLSGGNRPYFSVQLKDGTGQVISCTDINSYNNNAPNYFKSPQDTSVYCYPWHTFIMDLTSFGGQTVTISFVVSDSPNGTGVNFGYAYIDASCGTQTHIPISLCQGASTTLHAPTGYTTYSWNGPVNDTTQNLTTNIPGNYTLTTTSNCPTPAYYYTVSLNPLPIANYMLVQDTAPHTWDVYPNYTGGTPPYTYNWNWGDASNIDTGAYPSHVYAIMGTYKICVSITDANGCMDTSCQNDAVYRLTNNSIYSNMVYINVLNNNQTTGVNKLTATNEELLMYPNPNNGNMVLEYTITNDAVLEFIETNGKIAGRYNLSAGANKVNVSNEELGNGVYFYHITDGSNLNKTGKIVIMK